MYQTIREQIFYTVLSKSERVRTLRLLLNLTQNSLAIKSGIRREKINSIENNKLEITWNIANKIASGFNYVMEKRKINIQVTGGFFMESLETQKERILNYKIGKFMSKKNVDITMDRIEVLKFSQETENFILECNFPLRKKFDFYVKIINLNLKFYQFEESKIQVFKALEIAAKLNDYKLSLKIYSRLAVIYLRLQEKGYKELLILKRTTEEFIENLYQIKIENDEECQRYLKVIYYNAAIAYVEIEQYKKAIKSIRDITERFKLSDYERLDVKLLQSYCEFKNKNFQVAKNLYLEILQEAQKNDYLRIICESSVGLAKLYYEFEDLVNAEKYINIAIEVNNNGKFEGLSRRISGEIARYNFLIRCRTLNNDHNKIMKIFNETLMNEEIKNTDHLVNDIFIEMFKYCARFKLDEYIIFMVEKSFEVNLSHVNQLYFFIIIYDYMKKINSKLSQKVINYCVKCAKEGFKLLENLEEK